MSSIFILCLDSLADYKGHFLDCGAELSEGKYQISVRKCWGFVPLCPDTPPGCLWEWSTQEPPVCNARLKHTKFNFIFQHFLWKVETDGPDKGTVMCLTLTRGKKPKQLFPHWCLPLLLEDVPALQYLFKNLNKPMDISWLLAWQGIPEGWLCRRVRDWCGIRNGRMSS